MNRRNDPGKTSNSPRITFLLLVIVPILLGAAQCEAAGKDLFQIHCAGCHGINAKGLRSEHSDARYDTPDLTRLKEKFGGVFQKGLVREIVSGKNLTRGYPTDMPIWEELIEQNYIGTGDAGSREAATTIIINEIVNYLEEVQGS